MRMKTFVFKIMYLTCVLSTFSSVVESLNIDLDGPTSVEFRAAYFRPSDEIVREIYSKGWVDYGFEFSKMITPSNNLAVWGSVNWYRAKGHAACCGDSNSRQKALSTSSLEASYF